MNLIILLQFSLILVVYHFQTASCRDIGTAASFNEFTITPETNFTSSKPNQYPSDGLSLSYDLKPNSNNSRSSGDYTPSNNDNGRFVSPTLPVGPRYVRPDLVTDGELLELTEILYDKENSQLDQIYVNMQGRTRSSDINDVAPEPLLEVSEKALSSPTIAKMRDLFDNYEMDTSIDEVLTKAELQEEDDFIDAVMATDVMRQAMLFLQNKGIVSSNPRHQRDLLKTIWFKLYSRGQRKLGSSGFEHVFVNEINRGKLIGLHNWVYFNEVEKAGRLDYKGYLNKIDLGKKGKIIAARFSLNGLMKPVNTMFVGTSPELELALYTVCFELRADQLCPVSLGGKQFSIQTNAWRWNGQLLVGSAFPKI